MRSDKKREIQPTLPIDVFSCIHRLHKITGLPIKTIGEEVCLRGLKDKRIISMLSIHFRRDIRLDNTVYIGHTDQPPVSRRFKGLTKRISVRFCNQTYDNINALSYAADCTVARMCALLINACLTDPDFVNEYVEEYLMKNIDANQMKELQKIMKVLNSTGEEEVISWGRLLSFLMDDAVAGMGKVKESVNEFLVNRWDK
ncbi:MULTISPECIES: hypothetical protein [unclassified Sporosarcina]|uniref:hypothetical protein n=1 Tax=unclassified Sporosarcina TaxID=2647733 RepID=UPI0020414AA0|nr:MULTISPECIES: hypothetical protein [unclassified Sporosarcina]